MAGLTVVGAGLVIVAGATSESELRPTPPRVYSSCLAADTKPMPADADRCGGR
ncbi:hypothetical protein M4V62_42520 [Streptomyces durmitorensis]|uniref:Uncharacterized protein n=1 Tax=Streptomyces durmitorensis TaxID=319947 RepID=A0ABY4Q7J1_9ACTN|nr:hypothetical protein [Streptomyces durmitorensis]UQT61218.1 hypothetical protein M4V62_42520 [Streptomyces durmitorensis]